jgi:hypothetical protein
MPDAADLFGVFEPEYRRLGFQQNYDGSSSGERTTAVVSRAHLNQKSTFLGCVDPKVSDNSHLPHHHPGDFQGGCSFGTGKSPEATRFKGDAENCVLHSHPSLLRLLLMDFPLNQRSEGRQHVMSLTLRILLQSHSLL